MKKKTRCGAKKNTLKKKKKKKYTPGEGYG